MDFNSDNLQQLSRAQLEAELFRLQRENARQRTRLESDYKTITGLASGYDSLHLVNLVTDAYTPYYIENGAGEDPIMSEYRDFYSAHRAFIDAYCHPDFRERMLRYANKDYIREVLRDKKKHFDRIYLKIGTADYKWHDFVLIKFDAAHAEATQIAAGYIDVNDVVNAEQARLKAVEQSRLAEESQIERYNFLVNVAHELRTPLTLILGPLRRVLKSDPINNSTRGTITRVCQQADRMTTLLNTVLTSNKIEEGAEAAHPQPVDITDWITKTSDEFRDEASNHNVRINVKTDPSVGMVPMDEHLCRIVFSNLMMNALRYTVPGSPIEVTTRRRENFVRVSVRDYGSGIGDIDVSKLFERYYRATEEKTGFGIGLSYSKTIIDSHGGNIGAYNNTDGEGATFWFELPAGNSFDVAPAVSAQAAPSASYTAPKKLCHKTLLYVEDNHDLREYVRCELQEVCARVLTAPNGKSALELLSQSPVDIVLTDVMMPEIDGLQLCHIIKTDDRFHHIPVIMLSARADVESIKRGYEAQADFYLDKPFVIDQLLDVLEKKIH